ncbi:MAG: DNA cytosine methyltransferase [Steroidobacter sp.]
MKARPTVVSLFSGAGGLDIGLERAGWETVAATDIDPIAIEALRLSQDARIRIGDGSKRTYLERARIIEANVCDLRSSDLRPSGASPTWRPSLLAGGPPCQPWSSAGLQRGFRDSRGLLIAQMVRLTAELKPRFVLMENVRGLLTAVGTRGEHGEAIRMIHAEWENIGYAVSWALLNAADYGAPQRRVRLVMMATADHEVPKFPEPTHDRRGVHGRERWVSLGELLRGVPEPDPSDVVVPTGMRAKEILALKPGTGIRTGGTIEHQRPGGHWGYRQDSFLADLTMPSRTIRAASTPDWVRASDSLVRRLTWRECAALQGFPKTWMFAGQRDAKFRLIGNAVQTEVACALGKSIFAAFVKGPSKFAPLSPAWPAYFERRIRGAAADHRANRASRRRHVSVATL